ncbi:hypothetical protein evm_015518, partial [Chilo suppressalis]
MVYIINVWQGNNKSGSSRPQSISLASQCGDEQTAGDYSKHYVTLKQIGKGAYGCVKMAYRRSDRLLAVAKFILKEKVGPAFWVDGPSGRRLPLELSLLLTLQHPHITAARAQPAAHAAAPAHRECAPYEPAGPCLSMLRQQVGPFWVDGPSGRRLPLELSLLLTLQHPHITAARAQPAAHAAAPAHRECAPYEPAGPCLSMLRQQVGPFWVDGPSGRRLPLELSLLLTLQHPHI